jgi:hypothetical protein
MLIYITAGSAATDKKTLQSFEAENMNVTGAWSVESQNATGFWAVSGGKMLNGKQGGSGQATYSLNIEQPGTHRLWVRYQDLKKNRNNTGFIISVAQGENKITEKTFDEGESKRTTAEGVKKWGPGSSKFVWDYVDANLEAGHANITLQKSNEKPCNARTIDCFILTADQAYEPYVQDFLAPLYLKVTMGPDNKEPCFIHFSGRAPYRVWGIPLHNLNKTGLYEGEREGAKQKDQINRLTPGDESPWVDIRRLLKIEGDNRLLITAIRQYSEPLPESEFTVSFSRTASEEGLLKSFTRSGKGAAILTKIDQKPPISIQNAADISSEYRSFAESLPAVAGKRPKRLPCTTNFILKPEEVEEKVIENELAILSSLGMNALNCSTNLAAHPLYKKYGFDKFLAACGFFNYFNNGCINDPQLEKIQNAFDTTLNEIKEASIADQLLNLKVRDEPSSISLEHLAKCDVCAEAFREYCRQENLTPEFFGKRSWGQVRPTIDKADEKLYYHSMRFRNWTLTRIFVTVTNYAEKVIPNIRTRANYSNESLFNLLQRGVDWFDIQKKGALTYGWTEDWYNTTGTYQTMGWGLALMRASCKEENLPFGIYSIVVDRRPWDIKCKPYTEIGQGCRCMYFYSYGPYYAGTTDHVSAQREVYQPLKEIIHAIGAVEDVALSTKPEESRVAILYSHTTDLWNIVNNTLDSKPYGVELTYLYVLLRQCQMPVQAVTEEDLEQDRLGNIETLFVVGNRLRSKASAALGKWVKRGGRLYLGANAATKDEYGNELPLRKELGITEGNFVLTENSGRPYWELPSRKTVDTLTFGAEKMEAICGVERISAEDATVLATFSDGKPAVQQWAIGKGTIITCGFFPGLAHVKQAIAAKRQNDEQAKKIGAEISTYNASEFQDSYRKLMRKILAGGQYRPSVQVSHPLIEANRMDGEKGTLIALSNWSGQVQKDVSIEVLSPADRGQPKSIEVPLRGITRDGDWLRFTMDIGPGEFITIEKP